MRKKSHISLAGYLLESMESDALLDHKVSFYFGSILPDCTPSFITRRHTIEDTFGILEEEIVRITDDYDMEKGITSYYSRHLGVITHYIADYFTYPHNSIFTGTLKDHCSYENDLKIALRAYVKSEEAAKEREKNTGLKTVEDILNFIKRMHQEYLKAIKIIKVDCLYIVELCHKVVDAILRIFELSIIQSKIGKAEAAFSE